MISGHQVAQEIADQLDLGVRTPGTFTRVFNVRREIRPTIDLTETRNAEIVVHPNGGLVIEAQSRNRGCWNYDWGINIEILEHIQHEMDIEELDLVVVEVIEYLRRTASARMPSTMAILGAPDVQAHIAQEEMRQKNQFATTLTYAVRTVN